MEGSEAKGRSPIDLVNLLNWRPLNHDKVPTDGANERVLLILSQSKNNNQKEKAIIA